MAKDVAISAQDVSKIFGPVKVGLRALDVVSVDIFRNEFFTLLGPSGCGKTTLLRIIAGFEAPTEGTILLEGTEITMAPPFKRPVNTVFQSYALFPHLTVSQNVSFGLEMLGRSKSEITATVAEMLALVRMEQMADRLPAQLSGGQQQRVALARALAPRPSVLLLDEPLSALDLKLRKQMQIELKRMQKDTGITFVFVTHDQEEALTMSDRIAVMNAGKILQIGSPREIYNRPSNRFVAGFIGESNFLEGESLGGDKAGLVRLAGADIPVDGAVNSEAVTVAVRPEHLELKAPGTAQTIAGEISTVVYFGTDMHCHIVLENGDVVVARVPAHAQDDHQAGTKVGLAFAPGGLRIVGD
jgi:spermidine/putrescine transport system ATP-binding protein